MDPLTLALIGGGVAAAGAGAGYYATRKEGKRRAGVIEEGRNRSKAIQARLLANEFATGQTEQEALGRVLTDTVGPQALPGARDTALRRSNAVAARLPPTSMPRPGAPGSAGYTAATAGQAERLGVERNQAILAALARGRNVAGQRMRATTTNASVGLNEGRTRAQLDQIALQDWLERELGDTPNSVRNMQLLSALSGPAAQGAFMMAGRA